MAESITSKDRCARV